MVTPNAYGRPVAANAQSAGFVALCQRLQGFAGHHHRHHHGDLTMATTSAVLALVVALNTAATTQEQVAAYMPADQCLATMRAIWAIPAETVSYDEFGAVPAVDAACVDPAELEQ